MEQASGLHLAADDVVLRSQRLEAVAVVQVVHQFFAAEQAAKVQHRPGAPLRAVALGLINHARRFHPAPGGVRPGIAQAAAAAIVHLGAFIVANEGGNQHVAKVLLGGVHTEGDAHGHHRQRLQGGAQIGHGALRLAAALGAVAQQHIHAAMLAEAEDGNAALVAHFGCNSIRQEGLAQRAELVVVEAEQHHAPIWQQRHAPLAADELCGRDGVQPFGIGLTGGARPYKAQAPGRDTGPFLARVLGRQLRLRLGRRRCDHLEQLGQLGAGAGRAGLREQRCVQGLHRRRAVVIQAVQQQLGQRPHSRAELQLAEGGVDLRPVEPRSGSGRAG